MNWILHDSYKTIKLATQDGQDIIKVRLAKGVKIVKSKKKTRPYLLYILPINERKVN